MGAATTLKPQLNHFFPLKHTSVSQCQEQAHALAHMTEKRGQQLPGSAKAMTFIGGGVDGGSWLLIFFFF